MDKRSDVKRKAEGQVNIPAFSELMKDIHLSG